MILDDFGGRGEAVKSLIADVRTGRLPNALLITGKSGIGKKTFAMLIARAILCSESDAAKRPCGICKSCRRTEKGVHPDLLVLHPEDSKKKSIGIDDVRKCLDQLGVHAFSGGRRVVLYDGRLTLTEAAQNAFLKSLEEADTDQYFILVSEEESGILPTVRSRCRILRMQPAGRQEVIGALRRCGKWDEQKIQTAAEECGGSIGTAMNMLENERYWELRTLCMNTFFNVKSMRDVPAASSALKDSKDDSEALLTIFEEKVYRLLNERILPEGDPGKDIPEHWQSLPIGSLTRLADKLQNAHKCLDSNVGWQALADNLLYSITEEFEK